MQLCDKFADIKTNTHTQSNRNTAVGRECFDEKYARQGDVRKEIDGDSKHTLGAGKTRDRW